MAQHNDFGKQAEDQAVAHLQNCGYKILERNFYYNHAEIDIIALKDNQLVVVEVKARSSILYGRPETFVNSKKINHLVQAIDYYIQDKSYTFEVRFDIISIVKNKTKNELFHIENAFLPF